jgi:hypothetical protein
MPRYICKINDKYFEWSTIVDDMVTDLLTWDEFVEYYKSEYQCTPEDRRMNRVKLKGTSSMIHDSVQELVGIRKYKRILKLLQ